jgi:hypothetical protein
MSYKLLLALHYSPSLKTNDVNFSILIHGLYHFPTLISRQKAIIGG